MSQGIPYTGIISYWLFTFKYFHITSTISINIDSYDAVV